MISEHTFTRTCLRLCASSHVDGGCNSGWCVCDCFVLSHSGAERFSVTVDIAVATSWVQWCNGYVRDCFMSWSWCDPISWHVEHHDDMEGRVASMAESWFRRKRGRKSEEMKEQRGRTWWERHKTHEAWRELQGVKPPLSTTTDPEIESWVFCLSESEGSKTNFRLLLHRYESFFLILCCSGFLE